jgi:hypothetical protein
MKNVFGKRTRPIAKKWKVCLSFLPLALIAQQSHGTGALKEVGDEEGTKLTASSSVASGSLTSSVRGISIKETSASRLNLRDRGITDENLIHVLTKAAATTPKLAEIDLSKNNITIKGLKLLIKWLEEYKASSLKLVDLSDNLLWLYWALGGRHPHLRMDVDERLLHHEDLKIYAALNGQVRIKEVFSVLNLEEYGLEAPPATPVNLSKIEYTWAFDGCSERLTPLNTASTASRVTTGTVTKL